MRRRRLLERAILMPFSGSINDTLKNYSIPLFILLSQTRNFFNFKAKTRSYPIKLNKISFFTV